MQGAAVKAGMLAGRGEALLMMDADGATQVRDLERLEATLAGVEKKGAAVRSCWDLGNIIGFARPEY